MVVSFDSCVALKEVFLESSVGLLGYLRASLENKKSLHIYLCMLLNLVTR